MWKLGVPRLIKISTSFDLGVMKSERDERNGRGFSTTRFVDKKSRKLYAYSVYCRQMNMSKLQIP